MFHFLFPYFSHKHAAARVLQNTWRVVLRRRELEGNDKSLRLAASQRGLLRAILALVAFPNPFSSEF